MPARMKRFARMAAVSGLCVVGCAGVGSGKTAEVLFVVETPVDLGRLAFSAERGVPFTLSNVPEGATIFRRKVQPGQFCLIEVISGDLNVGYGMEIPEPICVRAVEGERVYGGHLIATDAGMRQAFDKDRLRAQLADDSVPVEATPKALSAQPFPLTFVD